MNPPSTTAELLVSQFAPTVLLTLKQVSQVTGQAGPTQVPQARRALVSGFGLINFDRGVCTSAAVLTEGVRA